MPRQPDGLTPRTVRVSFRLEDQEAEVLDTIRGITSRSDYLRHLIVAEAGRHRRRHARPSTPPQEETPA